MSNRLAALVAYGDSDSDSDDEKSSVQTTPSTTKGLVSYGPQDAEEEDDTEMGEEHKEQTSKNRPGLMDTASSRKTPPRGPSSSSGSGLKPAEALSSGKTAVVERLKSTADSRASSPSTPLPPDHSAAADVANTPTASQSPRIQHPPESVAIDEEQQREHPGSDREALRRQLLRPKPIPGVQNFGIPPEPEIECSSDLQEKIEHFYNIKMTRGIHFNQSLMKNKNFRNPHIYQSLVQLVDLDETGSNFEKSIEFFDFKGYPAESYAAGLAAAQDKAQERLAAQQAGTRTHLQFVHGTGTQAGVLPMTIAAAAAQHHAAVAAATGAAIKLAASYSHAGHTSSTAGAGTAAAPSAGSGRSGRKSKWDTGGPSTAPSSTGTEPPQKKSRH